MHRLTSIAVALGALAPAAFLLPTLSAAHSAQSHRERLELVYTMTNAAEGNEIVTPRRSASGRLTAVARTATGGLGSGAGLGSQGSLATDGEFLLAVNAGSDDVSVLHRTRSGLKLVDRMPSGGTQPISVAIDHD